MRITEDFRGREGEISRLFRDTFSASEGAEEGALVGKVAAGLLATTPADSIRVFLAEGDGRILGCGIFSRLDFPEDPHRVMLLSPMAVAIDAQRRGIGQALIAHALDALGKDGADLAATYGDPAYYGRTGFVPVSTRQIAAPLALGFPHGWLARPLRGGDLPALQGPSFCVRALNRPDIW